MFRSYFDKHILIGFLLALAILSWLATSSDLMTKARMQSAMLRSPDLLYKSQRMPDNIGCIGLSRHGCLCTDEKKIILCYVRAAHEAVLVQEFHELTIKHTSDDQKFPPVFQRQHKVQEFTRTVVTFTMAKRTIERFRKHVWAEDKGDEGAIFYFHNSQT